MSLAISRFACIIVVVFHGSIECLWDISTLSKLVLPEGVGRIQSLIHCNCVENNRLGFALDSSFLNHNCYHR